MRNHYAFLSSKQFHAPILVAFLLFLVLSCKTNQEGISSERINNIDATVVNEWKDNFLTIERYALVFVHPLRLARWRTPT